MDRYKRKIQKKLKRKRGKFIGKLGIAFGCSPYIKAGLTELSEYGIGFKYIIDNDVNKQGQKWNGLPVVGMDAIPKKSARECVFLICGNFIEEKTDQLLQKGYKKNQIVAITKPKECFGIETIERLRIYFAYKKVRRRFGGKKLLFTPAPYTGDAYLAGMYLESYIAEHRYDNIQILVANNSVKKAFELYGYKNVTVLSEKEANALTAMVDMFGETATGISYISHWGLQCQVMVSYEPYFKGTFSEMIRNLVLDIHGEAEISSPHFQEDIEDMCSFEGILEGKTVLLSPYANTFDDVITTEWWEKLAAELAKMGYTVYTNSMGVDEPVIKGTKGVAWKYSEIVPLLNRAGYFIGLRSGLCDVISSSECKKVILYPKYMTKLLGNYFSLNAMGLCDDAVELSMGDDLEDVMGKVIGCMGFNNKSHCGNI